MFCHFCDDACSFGILMNFYDLLAGFFRTCDFCFILCFCGVLAVGLATYAFAAQTEL